MHPNPELNRIAEARLPGLDYQAVELLSLDGCAEHHAIRDVDFVKVDAEGHELAIIQGGRRFLTRESPLLMFEIRHAGGFNLGLARELSALGYETYRLVPGLALLEPLNSDAALEEFQLNLFFCKPERARTLVAGGWLADTAPASPAHAAPGGAWQAWLERRPYARPLAEGWARRRYEAHPGWRENLAALDCYARAQAVQLADEACAALPADAEATDEPFVPACPRFEELAPGAGSRGWLLASLIEQRERLATFSSYFRGADALEALERLRELGWLGPEMERRRQLLRMRGCLQYLPEPCDILAGEEASLNPAFWRGEIPV